jgi:putative hydrolase of the HAD superfamily
MNLSLTITYALTTIGCGANAFQYRNKILREFVPSSTSALHVDNAISDVPLEATESSAKSLGLLTFDLDDTLYPISQIVDDANAAFVTAMERFGFEGVDAFDIVNTGKEVREELHAVDPEKAAGLTHTEKREMAIRREMERIILARKLQQCADDWATPVESLSPIVKTSTAMGKRGNFRVRSPTGFNCLGNGTSSLGRTPYFPWSDRCTKKN